MVAKVNPMKMLNISKKSRDQIKKRINTSHFPKGESISKKKEKKTLFTSKNLSRLMSSKTALQMKKSMQKSWMLQKKHSWIIPSQSKFRLIWDLLTTIWLLYLSISTPFWLGFSVEPKGGYWIMERIIDIHFILDIFFNFRTGYFNHGALREITEPRAVGIHYLKTWFAIDLFSSIPFDFILEGFTVADGSWTRAGKLFKLFRIIRLSKLFRFAKFAKIIENVDHNYSISRNSLKMIQFFVESLVLSHVNACCFYAISMSNCQPLGACDGSGALHKFVDDSLYSRYFVAFYWSVSTLTTIGYGDISPQTADERLYAIFVMLLGSGFYGFVIASMARAVSKFDINKECYNEKMDEISSYMNYRLFPSSLRRRVKQYYKHYLQQRTSLNEKVILNQLPTNLRHEVVAHLVHEAVLKVPIFHNIDTEVTSLLVPILKPVLFVAGAIVVRQHDVALDMFILLQGELDMFIDDTFVTKLIDGDSFGEENALNLSKTRSYTIQAQTDSNLYSLSRDELLEIFESDPLALLHMRKIACKGKANPKHRLKKAMNQIRLAVHSFDDRKPNKSIFAADTAKHSTCDAINGVSDLMTRLDEEFRKVQEQIMCILCQKTPRNLRFSECMHLVCCSKCGKTLTQCPACNLSITEVPQEIIYE